MKYLSTRGGDERLSFEEAVLSGLAPNGGLYIPSSIPKLPEDWMSTWSRLSFTDLALEIYSLFIPSHEIERQHLKELIAKSYSSFTHPQIAPLRNVEPNLYLLELWHGPTFAFKDVALQFLGNLFEFFLARQNRDQPEKQKKRLTVLGATSGDTGSAAIYGLRGKKDVSIFILYPLGRVSPIQEAQMTTVMDSNVFNVAVQGTFDDCQDLVKGLFNDSEFKAKYRLGAINSINWARILAQIVYYFSSYFELLRSSAASELKVQFVVPTGNFGDILAGFYAQKLGLPMGIPGHAAGLVIATNSNDILARFWGTGRYEKSDTTAVPNGNIETDSVEGSTDGRQTSDPKLVKVTLSPAMDILVSSNFERLLFYLAFDTLTDYEQPESARIHEAQAQVNDWMVELKIRGSFKVVPKTLELARSWFEADRANDEETSEVIRRYFLKNQSTPNCHEGPKGENIYLVDPHTAVGLKVAEKVKVKNLEQVVQVVLSTAHPAKFLESIEKAIHTSPAQEPQQIKFKPEGILPAPLKGILDQPKRRLRVNVIDPEVMKRVIGKEVRILRNSDEVDRSDER